MLLVQLLGVRDQQCVFRGKVVEQCAATHLSLLGDGIHRGLLVANGAKELRCGSRSRKETRPAPGSISSTRRSSQCFLSASPSIATWLKMRRGGSSGHAE